MRKDLGTVLKLVVLATLAMLGVIAFVPGRVELALRVYALLLCCVGIGLALSALRRAYPRPNPLRGSSGGDEIVRPASLARLEHVVALGVAGSFDFHHRLLPRLRNLAAGLLPARRHMPLEGTDAARSALGDETWDFVRPDRPPPEDRLARGIPLPELERAVASLERL